MKNISEHNLNYGFVAITVAICAIFGALQWLFLQQIPLQGMFETWMIRGALMLSILLTGIMIVLKFGRANTRGQDIILWVGLTIEMVIMFFTFVTVVHPDVIQGTDIEQFAKFVSGMNAITTVFVLVIYFALDTRAKNAYAIQRERANMVDGMYRTALDSPELNNLVRAAAWERVRQQLAGDLGLAPHQLTEMELPNTPRSNGNGNGARTLHADTPALPALNSDFLADAPTAQVKANGHGSNGSKRNSK